MHGGLFLEKGRLKKRFNERESRPPFTPERGVDTLPFWNSGIKLPFSTEKSPPCKRTQGGQGTNEIMREKLLYFFCFGALARCKNKKKYNPPTLHPFPTTLSPPLRPTQHSFEVSMRLSVVRQLFEERLHAWPVDVHLPAHYRLFSTFSSTSTLLPFHKEICHL